MRKEKQLIRLLRQLADLVASEAKENPRFAVQLDKILVDIPPSKETNKTPRPEVYSGDLPDLWVQYKMRGEDGFLIWLRNLTAPLLRALIKRHEFDLSKRSQKWNDSQKLADLIAHQFLARMSRGSSFLKFRKPD